MLAITKGKCGLQVLQRHSHLERVKSKSSNSHFLLPQMLPLIFRYLSGCEDTAARMKIIRDILGLLDSNASNIEAFMVWEFFKLFFFLTVDDFVSYFFIDDIVNRNMGGMPG